MSLADSLGYLAFGNPVSQAVINTTTGLLRISGIVPKQQAALVRKPREAVEMVSNVLPLWRLSGRHYHFIRLAGISGASAVILSALGSHRLKATLDKGEQKAIFETANRLHFIHSIALMTVPMSKRPVLTGTLMALGTLLFSGSLYYRAFTGEKTFSQFAPIGGFCLIISWLTLVF